MTLISKIIEAAEKAKFVKKGLTLHLNDGTERDVRLIEADLFIAELRKIEEAELGKDAGSPKEGNRS